MENNINDIIKYIGKRYGTFDPFVLADMLNIEVHWADIYPRPYGDTSYIDGQPIVLLANHIKDSNQKYFVLAHELGHVIRHEGLAAYYIANDYNRLKAENEADKFALSLITHLYVEEVGASPHSYRELRNMYGAPDIGNVD
ncbi:ImmA/IrrE family metallo-endopeptidase [Paucilactobacillus nenjiangensis]|uniref:ImmA/IrrE family metallo-endopeptidase n=1 Tax=Paucilactobacillus nenjiangensis TaxID=1296540 RepID=UPI003BB5CCD2